MSTDEPVTGPASPKGLGIVEAINAKCDALVEILSDLEVPGGPKFEDDHLVISWITFIDLGFQSKGDVGHAISDLRKCQRQAEKLAESLGGLPDQVVSHMEGESFLVTRPTSDHDNVTSSVVPRPEHDSYAAILQEFIRNIDVAIESLDGLRRKIWGDGTKGKNALAQKIALDIGRIYVELRGETPGYGQNPDGTPSTPYTKVVQRVIELMGLGARGTEFRNPCRNARDKIKSEVSKTTR